MDIDFKIKAKTFLDKYKLIQRTFTLVEVLSFGLIWMFVVSTIFKIPLSWLSYFTGLGFYFVYEEIISDIKEFIKLLK